MNLLASGISDADVVTTVSPSYAKEITTSEMGCGLDGMLAARGVVGVVNGVDTTVWTPSGNKHIEADYSAEDLSGKHACRQALLNEFALDCDEGDIILGVVARFASQKGLDLILELIPHLEALQARLVVLGTGAAGLENAFARASQKYPGRVAAALKFDVGLAHRITAGADVFLMPSRFEPCGLNQLYAMAYGTPPVVHAVGGLKDTVIDPGDAQLMQGEGTGFAFHRPSAADLHGAVFRAASLFRTDPDGWKRLQRSGMRRDFSWGPSAEKWKSVYAHAIAQVSR